MTGTLNFLTELHFLSRSVKNCNLIATVTTTTTIEARTTSTTTTAAATRTAATTTTAVAASSQDRYQQIYPSLSLATKEQSRFLQLTYHFIFAKKEPVHRSNLTLILCNW